MKKPVEFTAGDWEVIYGAMKYYCARLDRPLLEKVWRKLLEARRRKHGKKTAER